MCPITATIPRVQPAARPPGGGLPGTALPTKATMPLTPQMTQQIQQLPPQQRFEPAKAQPFKPAAAQPGPGQVQPGQFKPGVPAQPGQPGAPGRPGPGQAIVPGQPGQVQPGHPDQAGPGAARRSGPTGPGSTRRLARRSSQTGEFHPGALAAWDANHPGCSRGRANPARPPASLRRNPRRRLR